MEQAPRKYRILVVDDDDRYRESACLLLSNENYELQEARDSRSAKLSLADRPFHLCLLDSQMPDDSGEMRDDAGLEVAKWMRQYCFYTSRIILTSFEKIEFVKKAIAEHLVHGYYSKLDVALGNVANLTDLVAQTLGNRLVSISAKNKLVLQIDSLDLWDERGIVEKDLYETGSGVVRFKMGAVMAHIHRSAGVARIQSGTEVIGRAVFGGEIEVVPAQQIW